MTLFAEKFLVPFIPIATVAGIGGSCLYLYSDEVFGPGSGYDIFIVAQSTELTNNTSNEELYKPLEGVDDVSSAASNLATISLFSMPVLDADAPSSAAASSDPGVGSPQPGPATPSPADATPPTKKQRNYKCDVSTDSDKPVNQSCYITKKFDGPETANSSKNWINLSHIGIPKDYDYLNQWLEKPIIEVPSEVTKDQLKQKDNYFVIQVTESLFNQIKWGEDQTLDISSWSNKNEFFGKLKPLFAVYSNYVGIATEYVLAKADGFANYEPQANEATINEVTINSADSGDKSTSNLTCLLNGFSESSDNPPVSCEFFTFSSTTHTGDGYWYKTATFSPPFAKAKKIEKDKYYLVKFDQKFFARRISNMNLTYIGPAKDTEPDGKKDIVTMGTSYPVVVVGSTGSEKLFILTEN